MRLPSKLISLPNSNLYQDLNLNLVLVDISLRPQASCEQDSIKNEEE